MDIASVANDSKEPHLRQRYAFHCRFLKNEILISIDCNEIVTLYWHGLLKEIYFNFKQFFLFHISCKLTLLLHERLKKRKININITILPRQQKRRSEIQIHIERKIHQRNHNMNIIINIIINYSERPRTRPYTILHKFTRCSCDVRAGLSTHVCDRIMMIIFSSRPGHISSTDDPAIILRAATWSIIPLV